VTGLLTLARAIQVIRPWRLAILSVALSLLWLAANERAADRAFTANALETHASKVCWLMDDEGAIDRLRHDLNGVLYAYETLTATIGEGQHTVNHALLLKRMSELTPDPKEARELRAQSDAVTASIEWPQQADATYGEVAADLLRNRTLTDDQLKGIPTLQQQWPYFWPLFQVYRMSGASQSQLEGAAQAPIAKALSSDRASNLIGYAFLALAGLGLLSLRFLPVLTSAPHRPLYRLHRLWQPPRLVACSTLALLLVWMILQILGNSMAAAEVWLQAFLLALGGLLLVIALPLTWLFHGFVRKRRWFMKAVDFRLAEFRLPRVWCQSLVYATVLVVAPVVAMWGLRSLGFQDSILDIVRKSFWPWGALSLPIALFWGCLIAPLEEEIVYRGFVFSSFRVRIGPWWAALASALLFALCHGYTWQGTISVGIMGVGFALVYHHHRSLVMSMLTHAWINFFISLEDWLWMR
jgi:membrane protease YdiL (CAAX protease family)